MSKRARALVFGVMLAAMNLAGMTAVARAQPPDGLEQFRRGERASPGQSTTAEAVEGVPSRRARIAGADHRGRCSPAAAGPRALLRPQRDTRPGAPPQCLTNRAGSPAGSLRRWVCWPLPWRCPVDWPCWPPGGQTARCGPGRRPWYFVATPSDGAAAPAAAPSANNKQRSPQGAPAVITPVTVRGQWCRRGSQGPPRRAVWAAGCGSRIRVWPSGLQRHRPGWRVPVRPGAAPTNR